MSDYLRSEAQADAWEREVEHHEEQHPEDFERERSNYYRSVYIPEPNTRMLPCQKCGHKSRMNNYVVAYLCPLCDGHCSRVLAVHAPDFMAHQQRTARRRKR